MIGIWTDGSVKIPLAISIIPVKGIAEAVNDGGEIWIYSVADIVKGEELNYDYGYDMEHFLDHPCRCGSKKCIGYIVREDQRLKVKKLLKKRKKKKSAKK